MLDEIVPGCVVVAERRGETADVPLFPEEQAMVARAVVKRRREFTSARACAHAALSQLDVPAAALLSDSSGAPLWPAGVVGSITHCDGYRACAVARADELAAIGIDAEPNEALPNGLLRDIALPRERESLQVLMCEAPTIRWDRLLFSMKEAVYKAWYPLARSWLGFEDAIVTIDRRLKAFSARLLVSGPVVRARPLARLSGKWVCRDGLLLTAVTLSTGGESPVLEHAWRRGADGHGEARTFRR